MKKWVLKRATALGAWVSMCEQREMNARQFFLPLYFFFIYYGL